jgi:hypothetical protein
MKNILSIIFTCVIFCSCASTNNYEIKSGGTNTPFISYPYTIQLNGQRFEIEEAKNEIVSQIPIREGKYRTSTNQLERTPDRNYYDALETIIATIEVEKDKRTGKMKIKSIHGAEAKTPQDIVKVPKTMIDSYNKIQTKKRVLSSGDNVNDLIPQIVPIMSKLCPNMKIREMNVTFHGVTKLQRRKAYYMSANVEGVFIENGHEFKFNVKMGKIMTPEYVLGPIEVTQFDLEIIDTKQNEKAFYSLIAETFLVEEPPQGTKTYTKQTKPITKVYNKAETNSFEKPTKPTTNKGEGRKLLGTVLKETAKVLNTMQKHYEEKARISQEYLDRSMDDYRMRQHERYHHNYHPGGGSINQPSPYLYPRTY